MRDPSRRPSPIGGPIIQGGLQSDELELSTDMLSPDEFVLRAGGIIGINWCSLPCDKVLACMDSDGDGILDALELSKASVLKALDCDSDGLIDAMFLPPATATVDCAMVLGCLDADGDGVIDVGLIPPSLISFNATTRVLTLTNANGSLVVATIPAASCTDVMACLDADGDGVIDGGLIPPSSLLFEGISRDLTLTNPDGSQIVVNIPGGTVADLGDFIYDGLTGELTHVSSSGISQTVNLPLENFLAAAAFDGVTNILTLTLTDGTTFDVSLADLLGTAVDNGDGTFTVNGVTLDTCAMFADGGGITINSGTTAIATDDSLGTATASCGDIIHFWSSDGTFQVNVAPGSVVADMAMGPQFGANVLASLPIVDNGDGTATIGTVTFIQAPPVGTPLGYVPMAAAGGGVVWNSPAVALGPFGINDVAATVQAGTTGRAFVGLNDTLCPSGAVTTWVSSNPVNVTVVNNNDGSFDFTPTNPGTWSFNTEIYCNGTPSGQISTVSGMASGDPYFANVAMLLHFNGPDGSTTITDHSSYGRTVTAFGNAQIDTAKSKFGVSSCLFDGTGDYLQTPYSTSMQLGSSDFTLEAWLYTTTVAGMASFYFRRTAANFDSDVFIGRSGSSMIVFGTSNAVSWNILSGQTWGTMVANTWHHVALVRSGGNIYGYFDGARTTLATGLGTTAFFNTTQPPKWGIDLSGASPAWNGWMDEIRWTIGVARYTDPTIPVPVYPFLNGV